MPSFGIFEIANLVGGSAVSIFATFRYVRERSRLRGALRDSEPLAEDGWLTGSDEPSYMTIYNDQQRAAFEHFGRLALLSGTLMAAGLHIQIHHSISEMIGL